MDGVCEMSNSYCIVTDAAADLSQSMVEELGVKVIPMECRLDDKSYLYEPTGANITPLFFYEQMEKGAATSTSQINVFTYTDFFAPILEDGQDIIYIALSSGLTGSQQAAAMAAQELTKKFPDRRVVVIDSLSVTLGQGLLIMSACEKRDNGMGLDELSGWLNENKKNICHWFTVDDLKYLQRGGRLSASAAFFGQTLRIKPVMHVDDEGKLIPVKKVQGRKRSLKEMAEVLAATYTPEVFDCITISHGNCLEDAEYLKSLIQEKTGAKNFHIDYIAPIIGAHSGPGTVALFFYGTQR